MFLAYQDVTILEVFVIFLPWSIGSNAAGMEVARVGLSAPYSLFPLFKMKNEKKKKNYLGLNLVCCYCSSLSMTPWKQNHRITEWSRLEGTFKDHLVQLLMDYLASCPVVLKTSSDGKTSPHRWRELFHD